MASAALSSAGALAAAAARAASAGAGSSSALRTVTLLRPEHADAAVRCVAASFAAPPARQAAAAAAAAAAGAGAVGRLDPFTAAFNVKRASWARLCGPFIARAAAAPSPLSVVAYNRGSGEVDGVICVDDYLKQPPALYRGLPAEWAPTRAIFRELYTRFDATPLAPRAERSTLQCLYFSCVRPAARGAGVMKQLYRHTIEAARDRGFESIVASAAHPDVQRTLRDALGFEEVAAVDFAAFAAETGLSGFAKLPPGYEKLALMRRKLPSDLYV